MIAGHLSRRELLGIFLAALGIRLAAIVVMQPRLGADGVGFVSSARALLEHGPSALASLPLEHSPLYPLLLALGLVLPMDIGWLATLAQAVAGAATAVILARLTARETGNRLAGVCAGGITAVQFTFVFWTAYLLSETVFLFLVAVSADRALLLVRSAHPRLAATAMGLLAILTVAARPTGAAFYLALLVAVIVIGRTAHLSVPRLLASYLAPFVLLLGIGLVSVMGFRDSRTPTATVHLSDWARSAVQNGLLETDQGRGTSGVDLDINPPPIIETLPFDQRAEFVQSGPFAFTAHHPEFFAAQAGRKLRMFWSPVLPEYSFAHALGSTLYFFALYVLAAFGLVHAWRFKPIASVCVTSVVMFTLTSVVTIVDYDQRYRLPAELFLIPLAGIGLGWLLERAVVQASARQVTVETSPAQPLTR